MRRLPPEDYAIIYSSAFAVLGPVILQELESLYTKFDLQPSNNYWKVRLLVEECRKQLGVKDAEAKEHSVQEGNQERRTSFLDQDNF